MCLQSTMDEKTGHRPNPKKTFLQRTSEKQKDGKEQNNGAGLVFLGILFLGSPHKIIYIHIYIYIMVAFRLNLSVATTQKSGHIYTPPLNKKKKTEAAPIWDPVACRWSCPRRCAPAARRSPPFAPPGPCHPPPPETAACFPRAVRCPLLKPKPEWIGLKETTTLLGGGPPCKSCFFSFF